MEKQLMDKPCQEFLKDLASASPTPGGGGAAALVGGIAVALTSMVANLTKGKAKFIEVQEEIEAILVETEILRTKMLALVSADAVVFERFMKAYRLPHRNDDEQENRAIQIEKAAYEAAEVPLQIADLCLEILIIASKLMRIGNPNVITDATIGALLARAAMRSAYYNVHSNLLLIKDQDHVDSTETHMKEILAKAQVLEEEVIAATEIIIG
ncbi:MAG TPA: cyclodeaminase/cyclohydrolase family protein [Candidatus Avacidaminococcus intestinavium]|uniref:Cyclodeaminase/cyclohydrolase family protein n=1 Tax=Candidatus Avacidaminococcus intestinavium TaxID=2840684 RepID=A0A9D1MPL2_9FIRM|nr:cyclodeaminase/cyclohydrolase family protein [Candidatus Avacidaminococcus intestinavium]